METQKEEPKQESTMSLVERAEAAAARIEKAEAEIKATEARLQELRAKEVLGGKADAGQKQEVPQEETPAEYAKKLLGKK